MSNYTYIKDNFNLKDGVLKKLLEDGNFFITSATPSKLRTRGTNNCIGDRPTPIENILNEQELEWINSFPTFKHFMILCEQSLQPEDLLCPFCGKFRSLKGARQLHATCGSDVCRGKKVSQTKQGFSEEKKEAIQQKRTNYYMEHYGVPCSMLIPEVQEKFEKTMEQRYGVKHALQKKEFRDKAEETCLEHTGYRSTFLNPEVREKAGAASWTDEVRQKRIENTRKRYGTDFYTQTEEFKEKAKQTCLENYGDPYYKNLEKNLQSKLQHYRERTGDFASDDEAIKKKVYQEIKQKGMETNKRNRGGVFNLQDPDSPRKGLYRYEDTVFDSKQEFLYYLYLKHTGANFERLRNFCIPYVDSEGRSHDYYPDFRVEDQLVEVKNAAAVKEDRIINFFNGKLEYEKFQVMQENNVKIITDKEVEELTIPVLKHIYGEGSRAGLFRFLNQFRVNKPKVRRSDGPGRSTTLNTKGVNNGKVMKYIPIDELEEFLKNNPEYKLGKLVQ